MASSDGPVAEVETLQRDSSVGKHLTKAASTVSSALPGGRQAALALAKAPVEHVKGNVNGALELVPTLQLGTTCSGLRSLLNGSQIAEACLKASLGRRFESGEIETEILQEMETNLPPAPRDAPERPSDAESPCGSKTPSSNSAGYAKKVAAGVALAAGVGVATGGIFVAAGASAVMAAGAASGATGLMAAKKVEEANLIHSTRHDSDFVRSRSTLSRHSDQEASGAEMTLSQHGAHQPSLPEHVIRQYYFARLAYTSDADTKRHELHKLFEAFGEGGTANTEHPSFWQGPATEDEAPKWYLALSPKGSLHIVIRGTDNNQDWLHNFQGKMESESTVYHQYSRKESPLQPLGSPDLSFHQGFWERAKTVSAEMDSMFRSICASSKAKAVTDVSDEELEMFLKEYIGSRVQSVQLTGHSLGGAVALIIHRVWSNPNGKRFKVLRFMLQRFMPEVKDLHVPGLQQKFLARQQHYRSVTPHRDFRTTVFSAPPIFAAKADKADSVQEWLWSGQQRFKLDIEREELDQFSNAELVFFNDDPVPRLGFLPTGDQLLLAPLSSVLWLREDAATGMRSIFPVPPKIQRRFFSGADAFRNIDENCVTDHLMQTFEDFVLRLAPQEVQRRLGASTEAVSYTSPLDFRRKLRASLEPITEATDATPEGTGAGDGSPDAQGGFFGKFRQITAAGGDARRSDGGSKKDGYQFGDFTRGLFAKAKDGHT
eukprot:CAMPEP_0115224242 /NCGR_PEP_ID=MMETSP0270-20121206/29473_1 /TAXON_ID=71861 /ORGANISM="Scrippsiella trochoidea, Strain CCMP3099" /LENGTH=715 /DNA_ID=CAMNT_0002638545 /DNA_START=65 /DNA_END=2212 /DNA_ORIENTATION=-